MADLNEGKHMLSLILADAELETVPERFWGHPCVVVNAKKRKKRASKVLLDASLHHSLFKEREERNRRGRPDITHQFLMIGLESILAMDNGVKLYIHTRNDEMIDISPETRIPKNQNRFYGLFEELFRSGVVPNEKDPLITLTSQMKLNNVLEKVKGDREDMTTVVWLLTEGGERIECQSEMEGLISGIDGSIHLICILGGFSSGDFSSDLPPVNRKISIHERAMKSWAVEMELLSSFRRAAIRGSHTSGGA